jgi:hypothetical protein
VRTRCSALRPPGLSISTLRGPHRDEQSGIAGCRHHIVIRVGDLINTHWQTAYSPPRTISRAADGRTLRLAWNLRSHEGAF